MSCYFRRYDKDSGKFVSKRILNKEITEDSEKCYSYVTFYVTPAIHLAGAPFLHKQACKEISQ